MIQMLCKAKYILALTTIVGLGACHRADNPVPVTNLNYKILNIESDPRYVNLRSAGNSAVLKTGEMCAGFNCNGVILYRKNVNGEPDDFTAFDRSCTHEASGSAMEIDKAFPYLLVCPDCGSVFNMEGGYIEMGPAKYPLREFDCDFYNGDLRIY